MKKFMLLMTCVLFLLAIGMTSCDSEKEGTLQTSKKKIRLLSIGNSYSQDALAYVPFILQNMGVDVDIHIGILMQSSSTTKMHVDNFTQEKAAYNFYYFWGGDSWHVKSSKTIQWALENYEWDIIIQQGVPRSTDHPDSKNNNMLLHNLISNYVDYPVKFAWYQTTVRPAIANGNESDSNAGVNRSEEDQLARYQDGVVFAQEMMSSDVFEYLIPVGTAVRNARTIPTLDAMGDYSNHPKNTSGKGYLTAYDGVHLQEGLPCQIAAYTFVMALLDICGYKDYSILGETTRVTSEWASRKSIPGPHGDYIGSTDENCRIAQECVIMAMKHPYEITDMNYIINP